MSVALVTGAGQGIGRGIALRLAADGHDVALVDLGSDKIEQVAREIREIGTDATTFVADVSDRDQVFAAVDHAHEALGSFDVMINNAGIAQVAPLDDVRPEDTKKIWAVNVDGVLWGIQAAATKFRSLSQKGKIVNASSIAGHDTGVEPAERPGCTLPCSVSTVRRSSPFVPSPKPRPRSTPCTASPSTRTARVSSERTCG